jgi:hypothetical protein
MASQAPLTSSPATAAPAREPGGAAAVQQRLTAGIALFRRGGALRKPVSIISWGFVALILLVALLAPILAPADPNVQSSTDELLAIGTPGHLLGRTRSGATSSRASSTAPGRSSWSRCCPSCSPRRSGRSSA